MFLKLLPENGIVHSPWWNAATSEFNRVYDPHTERDMGCLKSGGLLCESTGQLSVVSIWSLDNVCSKLTLEENEQFLHNHIIITWLILELYWEFIEQTHLHTQKQTDTKVDYFTFASPRGKKWAVARLFTVQRLSFIWIPWQITFYIWNACVLSSSASSPYFSVIISKV